MRSSSADGAIDVDHAVGQRFVGREAHRIRHERGRDVGVAVAVLGERPHVGGRVLHRLVRSRRAVQSDRRRRADVRPRRHRGDGGRHEDERARGGGPGTRRSYVPDHRDRRGEDRLRDLPHGGVESPGRVDLDQDRLVARRGRIGDPTFQIVRDERIHDAVELEADDGPFGGGLGAGYAGRADQTHHEQARGGAHPYCVAAPGGS